MTNTRASLFLAICLLLAFSCSKPTTEETSDVDTALVDIDTATVAVDDAEAMREIIDYYGSIDTDPEMSLATFAPLEVVLTAARNAMFYRDSVKVANEEKNPDGPLDSTSFAPKIKIAYDAILAYQQAIKSGIKVNDEVPKLIDLLRTPGESDKTSELLPPAENSDFLSQGNFFFMGAAPFLERHEGTFTSPSGGVEVHYQTSYTENANYLFNSIYHQYGGKIDITFGPELRSYDGPQEIRGIGSLIHTFQDRRPVYFITEHGIVKGSLVSVQVKLVPEGMGCISDAPFYTFAAEENFYANEILGIYIPYSNSPVNSLKVNRLNRAVWTADLNGDGVADFASVSGLFEGISSDTMNEVLWFANIGGEWRIIDWGTDPDCT